MIWLKWFLITLINHFRLLIYRTDGDRGFHQGGGSWLNLDSQQYKLALRVYWTAIAAGASRSFANYIVAQSLFESGKYTSKQFREYKNPYGMGYPLKRPAINVGKGSSSEGDRSKYLNIEMATIDLLLWYRSVQISVDIQKINLEDLIAAIREKGYFTGSFQTYLNGLSTYYALQNSPWPMLRFNVLRVVVLVVGFIVAIYVIYKRKR